MFSTSQNATDWRVVSLLSAGLACAQPLHAAGFALIEQSVPGMGTAYAGGAATADSVGTLFFNPAGMTRLSGTRAAAAVHVVVPQTEFNNEGSSFSPLVGGAPTPGGDGGDAGGVAPVPHAYFTHQLNERTWIGLGINAPFGLTTEYDKDWVGRYHAIKSEVVTVNFNPSIAYKVNDQLSIGAGVSLMYLSAELTNAVDFGTLNVLPVPAGGLGGVLGPVGPGQADGFSKVSGDGFGWGVNLGLLFEVSEYTRIGLHYRSEVEQDVDGDLSFTLPTPALAGAFSNGHFKTSIDLPATASASIFHQLNDEWAVMANYTWTGWSSIPELRLNFNNGLPDGVTTFDWKDTSRVAVGTTYNPKGSDWIYRFGVAYDESPIRDAASRSARLPDADRIWVAVGAGFEPMANLKVDIGYAHLFIDDPKILKSGTDREDVPRGALRGSYESSVDILSVEARYTF